MVWKVFFKNVVKIVKTIKKSVKIEVQHFEVVSEQYFLLNLDCELFKTGAMFSSI